MFLSGRDIKYAIECGELVVDPRPDHFGAGYDETSIDLHLGPIEKAELWDIGSYVSGGRSHGVRRPELHLGSEFDFDATRTHLMPVPDEDRADANQLVFRRGHQVVVRQFGFLLWATAERLGTPLVNPKYICFVDAKSTRARTGIMVHFTAPTIHAGWNGHVALEITNLGPFDLVLCPNDAIAQLTVADITSVPDLSLKVGKSATQGQTSSGGAATATPQKANQRPAKRNAT